MNAPKLRATGEATAELWADEDISPITVIGTQEIRQSFDEGALRQAISSRLSPGVSHVVLNPDAHVGYGAPIGCVMVSPSHIYPGPVGVDIKCSMSLLQLNIPSEEIASPTIRRKLIEAICERTPTGAGRGQRSVKKARDVDAELGMLVATEGASARVCDALGIPAEWADRCEDSCHFGHDDSTQTLMERLQRMLDQGYASQFAEKMRQLGSYGGGNHFGECEVVKIQQDEKAQRIAHVFGLQDDCVAFLSHCGSRGFGHNLAMEQFRSMQSQFIKQGIPFPAGDRELVYAELGSPEANAYLCDMAMGANFATVNHLLINQLVLEAFQEVMKRVEGKLVYFISHNIARREPWQGGTAWVHRKGATRAYPAGHPVLEGTPFANTGHPILLPGNPRAGSAVMAAEAGAELSAYSVNHGAGRKMGRKHAKRTLNQDGVDRSMAASDILFNGRKYPLDEAPNAYKDFEEVLQSVKLAGLASEVARLKAKFVIKDSSDADD